VTTVWLVRHAATAWTGERWCGTVDLPLSAAGEAQLPGLVARRAAALPPEAVVVTSPLLRATATAQAIATHAGIPVRTDPDLREIAFGEVEGRTFAEIERDEPGLAAALLGGRTDVDWPGGESCAAVDARARAAWRRIVAIGAPAVVVGHGGLFRRLVPEATGDPGAAAGLRFEPASVTVLDLDAAGRARLEQPAP
jgi:probable phosphoglycerate mutase